MKNPITQKQRKPIPPGDGQPAFILDPSRMFAYRSMAENVFRREGPSKSRVRLIAKENYPQPFTAGIDPLTWDVDFTFREGLSFANSPALREFMLKFDINDPIYAMLRDVANHEIGHWEYPRKSGFGCPFDKPAYYTMFIEPIHDELKRSGKFGESFCKTLSQRLANAVTDVIDNYNVASVRAARRVPFSGQTLFWYLQGQESGRYTQEYTLFVKLNLALFGNRADKRLLGSFMEDGSEIGQAVKRLSQIFTPGALYYREHWERLARAYAREAMKFVTEEEGAGGFSLQYSPGDGTALPPQSPDQNAPGQGKGNDDKEGKGPVGEGQLGKDLNKDEVEKIMMGRRPGQGMPFFIGRTEGLDAYYSGLAKRIPIQAAGNLPGAQMQLIPLLYEPFDEEVHDPRDVSLGRLRLDLARGAIVPSVVRSRLTVDIPIRKEKRHLPDFLMTVIDSSGSMMYGGNMSIVPWGDQSYYHYAILTWYGIRRFFETEGILHKIGVGAAIFSDSTLTAEGIEDVKKLLLNPTSGGTTLDLAKVMEALRGKENAIFSMMSDGEIFNWNTVKDEFIALAKKNQFFMIQIGWPSRASSDMEAAGLVVKYVNSPKDAFALSIDLTVQRYRAVIASGVAGEAKKYSGFM